MNNIFTIQNKQYYFLEDNIEIIQLQDNCSEEDIKYLRESKKNSSYYKFSENNIGCEENKIISINLVDGCNLQCVYCFVEAYSKKTQLLSEERLHDIIDFNISTPTNKVGLYFSGSGEPLLNFKLLQRIPDIFKNKGIIPSFYEINTNGTLINDEIGKFFKKYNFWVNISLNPIEIEHNATRMYANGQDSYNDVMKGYTILKRHNVNVVCKIVLTPNSNLTYKSLKILEDKKMFYTFDIATPSVQSGYYPREEMLDVFASEFNQYINFLIKNVKLNKRIYSKKVMDALSNIHNQRIKSVGCNACLGAFHSDKKGNLFTCVYLTGNEETIVGNVYSGVNPNVIMDKELYAKHVNDYKECKNCRVRNLCGGGCFAVRYIENKDTNKHSKYLCRYYKIYWTKLIEMYVEVYDYITDNNNVNFIKYENN